MRFAVLVKATRESAGVMPNTELLAQMGKFNEELVKAGVMLAGEGLHPSAKGKRIRWAALHRAGGPFAETKELVAGFWIWKVKSKQEALDWLKRAPFTNEEIELRQIFEAEDFGADFTPELRAQEERLRAEVAAKQ
jgi:hypothetical protein